MGALILPAAGSVYVDANVVIYAVEKIEPYRSLLDPLWPAAQTGRFQIVTSELTWLETLTKPLRDGNSVLEALFRAFLTAGEVGLVPAHLSGSTESSGGFAAGSAGVPPASGTAAMRAGRPRSQGRARRLSAQLPCRPA
jgi:hypothetical protein